MNRVLSTVVIVGLFICAGCGDDDKVVNNGGGGGPATTFEAYFGGSEWEEGRSMVTTNDGGYISVGTTNSHGAGNSDIYVVRVDGDGDSLWTRTFGGDRLDMGFGVVKSADGGFAVMGMIQSFGASPGDIYLLKMNDNGDSLWAQSYGGAGGEEAWDMAAVSDGYIIAGRTTSYGAGGWDVYLVKTDLTGDTVWTRTFGGSGYEAPQGVAQTSDGGYIVVGQTRSFGVAQTDLYLIRIAANGDSLWARTYGSDGEDYGAGVVQTGDGGFMVAGSSNSSGVPNFYLIKTDADGDSAWTKQYGGSSSDECNGITTTTDGNFVLVGSASSYGAGGLDVYLIKIDAAGDTLWTKTHGGTANDYGYSIMATSDGGVIVAGATFSHGVGGDMYLLKLDADGNL